MNRKKLFIYGVWFKIILLLIIFVPSYSQIPYNPVDTTKVITSVLSHPFVVNIAFLLPVAKVLLAIVVIAALTNVKNSSRIVMGYYALVLAVTGVFQNMAITNEYGFVWLIGNTIVILSVSVCSAYDAIKRKSSFDKKYFETKRLWVVAPMLLAFLMPYTIDKQNVLKPAFGMLAVTNEAGVTYCMITPIIIGVMILFSKGVYKPIFSIVAFVGLIFGVMNTLTFFVLQSQSWWMGVLHLPLLIFSLYALILCRLEKESQKSMLIEFSS